MAERLVEVDRETPMLLPPDLREWSLMTLAYNMKRLWRLKPVSG